MALRGCSPPWEGPGKVLATGGGPRGWEESKCRSCLQGGGPGELQAALCHLHLREGRGSKYSWKRFPNVLRDKMIRNCQRGFRMGKSRLTNPTAFCSQSATPRQWRRGDVYFDYSKAFTL